MSIAEVISIGASILISLGGAGGVVIYFSTWLGRVWAARILEQDRLKYGRALEKTKADYEKQLEAYKQELEKSKSLFIRYSESQFNLYNDLWGTLCKLKSTVDDLWGQASAKNLMSFALHLNKTVSSIETHRLLIEDDHYEKLKSILNTLNKFRLSKENLIRLRQTTEDQIKSFKMDRIEEYIRQNKESKVQFENLLETIVKDFKTQIRAMKVV
ncbi:MAG: hypothetical protein Q8L37_04495 [Candidatus Gottesmanbacteria bacterium]|nr:hypothetical protein [Candidatus Gottesmanbacteria bacterium]